VSLTRDDVVAEARKLVNANGLDGLSMRRLGARLGVAGPALYRHFSSKQEIIDALGRTFFVGKAAPDEHDSWQKWLEEGAFLTRKQLLSCRDGARIVAMARPNLTEGGQLDRLLAPLIRAGFDEQEAILASHLVGRTVIGWTLSEQENDGQIPPASANIDPEEAYRFAVKCVIAGLEMKLMAKRMSAPEQV
jgi:TetR/AcrR family tetracycline transcriptional repressor